MSFYDQECLRDVTKAIYVSCHRRYDGHGLKWRTGKDSTVRLAQLPGIGYVKTNLKESK